MTDPGAPHSRLDCESVSSARATLASVLGLAERELIRRLRAFDLAAYLSAHPHPGKSSSDLVFDHVLGDEFRSAPAAETCWFHGTRVPRSWRFAEGLLPTPAVVDRLWGFFAELTHHWHTPREWQAFRQAVETRTGFSSNSLASHWADFYNFDVTEGLGPFGSLMRGAVTTPEAFLAHDFCQASDTVSGICVCYQELFGRDLLSLYTEATAPCVVKFFDSAPREDAVQAALYYVHAHEWGDDAPGIEGSTCFNGEGRPVPGAQILEVEFLG